MTKQHFIALAKAIADIREIQSRRMAATAVAEVAAQFNPRFDKARFFEACGL